MHYSNKIEKYDKIYFDMLLNELDVVTFNRFRPFFENEILHCKILQSEWLPWLQKNMILLKNNDNYLFGGTFEERAGISESVDGISYTSKGVNSQTSNYVDAFANPLIIRPLATLIRRFNLDSRRMCGGCSTCGNCEICMLIEEPLCCTC